MNFITESNRLNIDVNKTVASSQVKEKSKADPFARENGQNSFIRKWPYSVLKTSPITHTSDSKVVAKRKKRQNWSKMEDDLLIKLVRGCNPDELKWPPIAIHLNKIFDSTRSGKQCRERWLNHLRPDLKKGKWTTEEEYMIEYFYNTFGPKWSTMAKLMKNRADNDIKNKWNSMKRLEKAGKRKVNTPTQGTTGTAIGERKPQQVDNFARDSVVANISKQEPSSEVNLIPTKYSFHETEHCLGTSVTFTMTDTIV